MNPLGLCDVVLTLFIMVYVIDATQIKEVLSNYFDSKLDRFEVFNPNDEKFVSQNIAAKESDLNYSYLNRLQYSSVGSLESLANINTNVEKVTLQISYECLCPYSRELFYQQLVPLVKKLGFYINFLTYPYGKAKTSLDPNGDHTFRCQHGPAECYGNMLHACVIDALQNNTLAVLFNACLMGKRQAGRGSDDRAADVCGKKMGLEPTTIKRCAKGKRGVSLLKYYGDQSKKAHFKHVPDILINGKVGNRSKLMKELCDAFKYPPNICKTELQQV